MDYFKAQVTPAAAWVATMHLTAAATILPTIYNIFCKVQYAYCPCYCIIDGVGLSLCFVRDALQPGSVIVFCEGCIAAWLSEGLLLSSAAAACSVFLHYCKLLVPFMVCMLVQFKVCMLVPFKVCMLVACADLRCASVQYLLAG